MTGSIGVVAMTSATLWRRELATTLGIRERALVASLAAFAVAMVGFSLFLAWILSEFVSTVVPIAEFSADQRALLRLVLAGLFLGTAVYFLVLCGTLPPRDRLATALALLPVKNWRAQVGTLLPTFIIGSGVALVFGLPTLPMIAKLVDSTTFQPAAIGVFIATITLVAVLIPGLFFAIRDFSVRTMRLPLTYSLTIGVTLTLVIVAAVVGADLIPRATVTGESAWNLFLPTRALSEIVQPRSSDPLRLGTAAAGLLAWFLLAVGLAIRAVRFPVPDHGRLVAAPSIRFPERGSARFATFMFELVLLSRLPQFIVTATTLLLIALAFPVAYTQPVIQSAIDQIAALPIVAAAAIGAYSFGATRRVHWVGTTISAPRRWLCPKPLAALTASIVLSLPYVTLMLTAGLPFSRFLDIAALGLSMWGSAVLAGVLVPFMTDQPLSATVTSAATVVLWAGSTFGLRWLFATMHIDSPIPPTLCGVALALSTYFAVARTVRTAVSTSA